MSWPHDKTINEINQSGATAENCNSATQINFNIFITKDLDAGKITELVKSLKENMRNERIYLI